jgi:acyl-coenzyme A synthetase/AMP-(fatty) acid ligase
MPKFDPEFVMQTLERYPVTTLCCPPTGFRMLTKTNLSRYNIKHLRHCAAGGEALKSEVVEQWLDGTGRVIHEGYGQTETVVMCCSPRCLPVKLGSLGKPVPGMDVKIVNDAGEEVGSNVEGEIALRIHPDQPVGLFSRYIDKPEKTAATFRGDYYVTGDFARRDDEGYFWFSSRADDVIISAGYRIGPHEVENVLLEHPAVEESAVVSSPDETRGEIVKAFVVLSAKFQDQSREALVVELQNHVRSVTAPYKYPRKIEFVDSLPKTVSGKIRRVELRNKEWNRS